MTDKSNSRIVYSTETAGKCAVCGWPQRSCQCSTHKKIDERVADKVVAKLRTEKKGRGGKTVTVIYDLPRNQPFLQQLSDKLKRACGTGGTVTDNTIELHGDLRDRVRAWLQQQGYTVKG